MFIHSTDADAIVVSDWPPARITCYFIMSKWRWATASCCHRQQFKVPVKSFRHFVKHVSWFTTSCRIRYGKSFLFAHANKTPNRKSPVRSRQQEIVLEVKANGTSYADILRMEERRVTRTKVQCMSLSIKVTPIRRHRKVQLMLELMWRRDCKVLGIVAPRRSAYPGRQHIRNAIAIVCHIYFCYMAYFEALFTTNICHEIDHKNEENVTDTRISRI